MRFSILCFLILLAVSALALTDEQPLSYSVSVELVQIPVHVLDKTGTPVAGLKKDDLQIFEDGVEQQIVYVDELHSSPQETNFGAVTPETSTQTTASPPPPRTNSVFLIFDACNSGKLGLEKHRKFIRSFIENFHAPSTIFSVVLIRPTGDYEILQDFTSEKSELLSAIDRVQAGTAGIEERISNVSSLTDSNELERCVLLEGFARTECIEESLRTVVHKANAFSQAEQLRSANSIASLKSFFAIAEHVPGQKSVILISEGMDPAGGFYYNYGADVIEHFIQHFGLPPNERSMINEVKIDASRSVSKVRDIQDLITSANASGLQVYWINPEYGKKAEDISSELGPITSLSSKFVEAPEKEFLMRGVAEETGGAALSSSDLADFYRYVTKRLHNYYLISYRPSRALHDGRVHKIEVKARRGGLTISYANDFKDFTLSDRINSQLAAAHDFPDQMQAFPLAHEISYFLKEDGKFHLIIHAGVSYREIQPEISGENVLDDIHFSLILRGSNGKILFDSHPILKLRASSSDFTSLKESGAILDQAQSIEIAPGDYDASVAVMDVYKWKASSDLLHIHIPGASSSQSCLSVSPLLLASSTQKSDTPSVNPVSTAKGEIVYHDQLFQFSLNRIFPATGGLLNGFYQIYNAKDGNHVSISFRLYKDHNTLISQTSERQIAGFTDPIHKLISNHFSVPYKNLAPGSYDFEIVARETDTSCSATSRANFQVQ